MTEQALKGTGAETAKAVIKAEAAVAGGENPLARPRSRARKRKPPWKTASKRKKRISSHYTKESKIT